MLLATKLYAPRPGLLSLARPRLLARLDAALTVPLTLVVAPAGFGKTTLVSDWLAKTSAVASWLSLSPDDSDLPRFLAYLAAALMPGLPPAAGAGLAALANAQPPAAARTVITALLNALAERPGPGVLVLDDYHTLSAEPVHDALAFCIDHLPPAMHVVLISRAAPPLPLARWRAKGWLAEVEADALRFTPAEAADFLAQTAGLSLLPEQSQALAARTEGWIAGLHLAALSLQTRPDAERAAFIQGFTGEDRFVFDYLGAEVFQQLPRERQQFLLETSILETLSGPLCAAITGRAEAGGWLAALAAANLFTTPLDHVRQWYRYHHLFRDFLRARLAEAYADVPALHRRAAQWLAEHGRVPEAIEHALAAADWALVAGLIEQVGDRLWTPADMVALVRWITPLPEAVRAQHPRLLLFFAWALLLTGELARAEACLQTVAKLLEAQPHSGSDLPGILLTIQAAALARRDRRAAVARYARAAECLPETPLNWRGAIFLGSGFAHQGLGDYSAAAAAFTTAGTVNQAAGNAYAAVYGTYYLGQAQLLLGGLRQAQRTFEYALTLAAPEASPTALLAAWGYLGLAEIWRERNDLEAATRYALEAVRLGKQRDNAETIATGYLTLARIEYALGHWTEALVLLQQAEPLTRHANAPALPLSVRVWRGRLWLAQGQPAWLDGWLSPLLHDANSHEPARLPEHALLVRWLLATGRVPEAQAWLDRLLAAEPVAHRGPRLELQVLRALAAQALGSPLTALAHLEPALAQAQPEGYRRLFLDEGPDLLSLLGLAVRRGLAGYAGEYAQVLLAEGALVQPDLLAVGQALLEPLSATELSVLRLVAAGLSNQRIAAERVVGLNTVKWHLKNIYGKLGVRSRTAAVARARSLSLL